MIPNLAPLTPALAGSAGIPRLIATMGTDVLLIFAQEDLVFILRQFAMTMIHVPKIHVLPDNANLIQ
jgi:hypothetical protein